MTNKEIARHFNQLASFMELYKDNPFKIRSYANGYLQLRKVATPLSEMTDAEMGSIKGVGKSLVGKIREILETGKLSALEEYKAKTPQGVQDMMEIKGFGAKKVRVIWKELGAETLGEVLYACNENRLITLNGFGQKTQADLKKKIEYYLLSKGHFHYATLEKAAMDTLIFLQKKLPDALIELTGDIRRTSPTLKDIEIIVGYEEDIDFIFDSKNLTLDHKKENIYYAKTKDDYSVCLYQYSPIEFGSKQFLKTGSQEFIEAFVAANQGVDFKGLQTEQEVFDKANLPYILPELRESATIIEKAKNNTLPSLVGVKDIKGVVHAHTTYSDGLHTLREMAEYTKNQGFEYLGITDHSKSAFYANGLKPDRVLQQMEEIDQLNEELAPFKIFKGIESDILNDGSLDYEEDILQKFDFIIASVHSNLKMTKEKATQRLLTAIQNPYTTILGHPTGRLLLSREGYPIDHKAIIEACAKHQVSIELNANPYRLDLDWQWIAYATSLGVAISINPDAHSTGGIHDIKYGVLAARKGQLTAKQCLTALNVSQFADFLKNQKSKVS